MHEIDISPLWDLLNKGLLVLLMGVALWIGLWVRNLLASHAKFIDAQTQKQLTDAVNATLQNAIQYALNMVSNEEKQVKPTVNSWVVQVAAQYAINHAGAELDKLGKRPEDIASMVLARLPDVPVKDDLTGAKAPVVTVEVGNLPPVVHAAGNN